MNDRFQRLLPCPFCGSPAEIERGSDHHGEWFNLGCSRHWGNVSQKRACIAGRIFYMEDAHSEDEAVALWNTRAVQQPAEQSVNLKRRPYNASGSLSEYGVFPESDAQ